jgi:hypothetical protein
VCPVEAVHETISFWRAYIAEGDENPTESAFFPTVLDACAWLDLTDAACADLSRAIEVGEGDGWPEPSRAVPRAPPTAGCAPW